MVYICQFIILKRPLVFESFQVESTHPPSDCAAEQFILSNLYTYYSLILTTNYNNIYTTIYIPYTVYIFNKKK